MEFISLILTVLPYILAILLALMLCILSVLYINNAIVAMGTMAAIFLLETASMSPLALNLGLWLYPPDFLVLLLLPAFIYRLVWLKKIAAIPRAWWLLGAVWMVLFAWGLLQYGTGAGVDFRPFFYLWLGAAYLSTFEYDETFSRRFLKFFVIMGGGICAIAYYRWTMGAIDYEFHRDLEMLDTTGVALLRVVPANAAYMVTCALIVVAYQAVTDRSRHMAWPLAMLFVVSLIAMQHRSVWMATMAGFVALVLALQQLKKGSGSKLFSMVLGAIVVLVLIVVSGRFQGAVDSVGDQAARATSTTSGTFVGRVEGWQTLLKMWVGSGSAVTYLVGKPFGSGYERYASETGGAKIGYMPHNFYVQLLYRGGLVGLFAFLWAVGKGMSTLWAKLRRKDDAIAPLLFAMLVAQLVYYIPYGIDYNQMILFGLLLGMITQERTKLISVALITSINKNILKPYPREMSSVR
jgi:hypothetical protein